MLKEFVNYLTAIYRLPYFIILIAAVVIGTLKLKKLSNSNRIFFLLLCLTLFNEIGSFFYKFRMSNNAVTYNSFTLIQYAVISIAFFKEIRNKYFLFTSLFIFYAFAIFNGIYWQSFVDQFGSNLLLLESLFIIIWVMLFFIKWFNTSDSTPAYKYSLFLLAIFFLIYAVVSIISFGFFKITKQSSYWNLISFWVRVWTNYFLYFSFIISFLIKQKSLNGIITGK